MKIRGIIHFNRCDVFLGLWVVYYLQGILYSEGGGISTSILFIQLLISLVCAYKTVNMRNIPVYFTGLNMLLVLFTAYGVFHMIQYPGYVYYTGFNKSMVSYDYIKSIYLSLLPIYPFYYYSRIGLLNLNRLKVWFFIFIISCTMSYYRMERDFMELKNVDEVTNNSSYLFLSLFPGLILFRKQNIIHYILLAYIMAYVLLGMKRGAIMISAVMMIYYFWKLMKYSNRRKKIIILLAIFLFIYVGIQFIEYRMSISDYMMERIYRVSRQKR